MAHPLFPVAPEWALITSPLSRPDDGLSANERRRGVHAGHDLVLHRPIRQDERVSITSTIVGVEATTAGAGVTQRFDTIDGGGEAVWTTWMLTLYRGVAVDGPDVAPADRHMRPEMHPPGAALLGGGPVDARRIDIAAVAAHVYTECARIWNPIHTDVGVARAAGLPAPILHGTATLALGITAALEMLGRPHEAVRRVGGSFRAMVLMPSTVSVELFGSRRYGDATAAPFVVLTDVGGAAVDRGFVVLGAPGH